VTNEGATHWHKGLLHWVQGGVAYLSVVFTWQLPEALRWAAFYRTQGLHVRAGGPAVMLNPEFLARAAHEVGGDMPTLARHNPDATFTSRGCIRRCPFCAVPRIEPHFVELTDWKPRPIVCDNNLTACSKHHFNDVVDRLKHVPGVDFTQGLDARLLTDHHAQRLAELDISKVRLAWDHTRDEKHVYDAIMALRTAGIGKKQIAVYVLVGFDDTPQDAIYRCETLKRKWGIHPRPMRFQPLDAMTKNSYVHPAWTDLELKRFLKYWWHTRWFGSIPYDDFWPYTITRPDANPVQRATNLPLELPV